MGGYINLIRKIDLFFLDFSHHNYNHKYLGMAGVAFSGDKMRLWQIDYFNSLIGSIWQFTKMEFSKDSMSDPGSNIHGKEIPRLKRSHSVDISAYDVIETIPCVGDCYILAGVDIYDYNDIFCCRFIKMVDNPERTRLLWQFNITQMGIVSYFREPNLMDVLEVKIHKTINSDVQKHLTPRMNHIFREYSSAVMKSLPSIHPDIIMNILDYTPIERIINITINLNYPYPGKWARIES